MTPRLTEAAAEDLEVAKAHITTHADGVIAEQVINRIGTTITMLCRFPQIGHDGQVGGTFEMLVPRLPFMIVCRIDFNDEVNELIVLRVYHTARKRD